MFLRNFRMLSRHRASYIKFTVQRRPTPFNMMRTTFSLASANCASVSGLSLLKISIRRPKLVLVLGCGNGSFLSRAYARCSSIYCISSLLLNLYNKVDLVFIGQLKIFVSCNWRRLVWRIISLRLQSGS